MDHRVLGATFFVSVLSSLIQGVLGFGFAAVFMTLLPIWLPFRMVASMELILGTAAAIRLLYPVRKQAKLVVLVSPLIGFFVLSTLGVHLLMNVEERILRKILGGILILLSAFRLSKKGTEKTTPSFAKGLLAGSISGLLGGLFNLAGPPLAVYYLSCADDLTEYNATMQLTFLVMGSYSLLLHFLYGNLNVQTVRYSLVGFIAIFVGAMVAEMFRENLNKKQLSICMNVFMMIVGILSIIKI